MKKSFSRRLLAAALLLALSVPVAASAQVTAAQTPQAPQPQQGGVDWSSVGWGAASIPANCVYFPLKMVYAILGGLTGGGAYLITAGNSQVSDTIWRSSLGGDYVLTPDMLRGDQPINFSGPTATSASTNAGTPAAAAPPVAPATAAAAPAPGPGATGGGAPSGVAPDRSIE